MRKVVLPAILHPMQCEGPKQNSQSKMLTCAAYAACTGVVEARCARRQAMGGAVGGRGDV
jgi:hypothetical protein